MRAVRPVLLDAFCGAGGAGHGYWRAGFRVVGIDIKAQPYYPYEFIQGDALEYIKEHGHEYDAIHASPPCQGYSRLKSFVDVSGYPKLLEPVRDLLIASGKPWVIENVIGAPLVDPVLICGAGLDITALDPMTGGALVLARHRIFESNVPLVGMDCRCAEYSRRGYRIAGVYGGGTSRRPQDRGYVPDMETKRALMGMHWTRGVKPVTEAIPPRYSEHVGRQLLQYV